MSALDDFGALVNRYLDGTATAAEVARLDERLRTDPKARHEYAELLNLDSALAEAAASFSPIEKSPSKVRAFPVFSHWLAMAAAVALAAVGLWWWQSTPAACATVA